MNDFLSQLEKFSNAGQILDVWQISVALVVTFGLCLCVAKTYQITYKGVSFSPAFMHTLILCGMVISVVMLIIGSNIARAFSLVGALSIIRFRNAVKDPRDVAYIFLSMGIGMATGTGFYRIALALTIICCLAMLFLTFVGFGEHGLTERVLRIQTPLTKNFENIFDDTLKNHATQFSLMSAETTRMGTELELTFAIKVPKTFSSENLMRDLSKLNENLKVQILGSNHVLEL